MKISRLLTVDEVLEEYGDILTPFQIEKLEEHRKTVTDLKIQVNSDNEPDIEFPIHYMVELPAFRERTVTLSRGENE